MVGCGSGVLRGGWAVFAAEPAKPPAAATQFFDAAVLPFVKRYCLDCHSGAEAERGVHLDKYRTAAAMSEDRATWRKVLKMLRARKMPPEDSRRPKNEEYDAINAWLEATLGQADRAGPPDPGRVTIRRLNRAEYTNTVRDLLGVEFNATADFPSDDVGYGFDNIGDVLTLPPLLMEKYLAAAEQIAAKAVVEDKPGDKPEDHPESHRRTLLVAPGDKVSPDAPVEQMLRRLATRAYRRPIRDQELARLLKLVATARAQGDGFEAGIQLALQAILVSPHFLFRVELDPEPNGVGPIRALDEYELASRLSYFLWSSMPDDQLFDLAARGKLREYLDRQVRRMLGDPKSKALVENFAGQWLQLRNLDLAIPDKAQFPAFDDDLRRAMRTESEMFFETVVREDRSVLELLDADFTFVNARLARHYGLEGVEGDQFRRVSLRAGGGQEAAKARGGVLTQAAVLTGDVESHADLAGETRQVGAGEHPRHAAPGSAAECSHAAGRRQGRGRRHVAPAHGAAPQGPQLCRVPQGNGRLGLRPGKLRRRRRLADEGRQLPYRRYRGVARRPVVGRPAGAEGPAPRQQGPVRPLPGGEVADLRRRPRHGTLR